MVLCVVSVVHTNETSHVRMNRCRPKTTKIKPTRQECGPSDQGLKKKTLGVSVKVIDGTRRDPGNRWSDHE